MSQSGDQSLFDLSGRIAVVTGGAGGLGRMIAEGLLRAGAKVIVTSRKADACELAEAEMAALGDCSAIQADFSDPSGAVEFAAKLGTRHDRLDILVNNAGRTWGAPFETFPDRGWPAVMMVNVQVPFKLIQLLLPMLGIAAREACPARIINIGSVAGLVVEPLEAYSYSASKAAIHQITRQLAAELAPRNVTVNTLVPGYFPSLMTAHLQDEDGAPAGMLAGRIPLGRLGSGADIAGAVQFLASRAGAYVTGSQLVVDGGISGCR